MKLKKQLFAVSMSILFIWGSVYASANGIEVYVDNVKTTLNNSAGAVVEPFIQNGSTYVPLRGVSQALGCQVEWDGNNKTVKIYKDKFPSGEIFRSSSDDIKVYIDDEKVDLKDANGGTVKPFIIDGTTYIPLRGVSQALGCQVEWDGSLQRVSIYQNTVSPNGATLDFVRPYDSDRNCELHYESNGDYLEMDGIKYTNALGTGNNYVSESSASFNLNGKYNYMTMTVGHYKKLFEEERKISFIVDGKIAETYILEPNCPCEEITVPLDYGLQLKIIFNGCTAMGDIVFH